MNNKILIAGGVLLVVLFIVGGFLTWQIYVNTSKQIAINNLNQEFRNYKEDCERTKNDLSNQLSNLRGVTKEISYENDSFKMKEEINKIDETKVPFQNSKFGFYGTVTLSGYLEKGTMCEYGCESKSCCDVSYAWFKLASNENKSSTAFTALEEYFKENEGNSFINYNSIGLGCIKENKISYLNGGDKSDIEGEITGNDYLELVNSSASHLVKLQFTKPIFTGGMDAPACYTHFRNFQIVK